MPVPVPVPDWAGRWFLRSACFVLVMLLSGGCERSPTLVEFSGRIMGTTFAVKVRSLPEGVARESVAAAIRERLDDVNSKMSTYLPDSELSRFNTHAGTEWFPVSRETATVVAAALEVARQTGGAFDPTVGPLVDLWGFGPGGGRDRVPTDLAIALRRALVGHDRVRVRDDGLALRKAATDVRLDLSAIAKGYAVDRIAEYLSSLGIEDHFVEIGGEIRATGEKAAGLSWRIAIESPRREGRAAHAGSVFDLRDRAVATSGDYRNYRLVDDRSHTIDPRTGRPVTHRLASASVFAPTAMEADAWATALMVLGPSEGYNLACERDLAALFILRASARESSTHDSGGSEFTEKRTPGLEGRLESSDDGGGSAQGGSTQGGSTLLNWTVFIGALFVFVGVVAAMSVGVIFGDRRIKGSCGGLETWRDEIGRPMCEACVECPEKRLECELEHEESQRRQ